VTRELRIADCGLPIEKEFNYNPQSEIHNIEERMATIS